MEQMFITPSLELCIVTKGTLANGKPSRAAFWSKMAIVQKHEHPGRCYTWEEDTFTEDFGGKEYRNPKVYFRRHWLEEQEYYKKAIRRLLAYHFGSLEKGIKANRLRGPFRSRCQEFDSHDGRKVFYIFPDAKGYTEEDVDSMFNALVATLKEGGV